MKRRTLLHRMGGLPLLFPAIARAQPASRVRTVGVTFANLGSDPEAQERANALRDGLRDLGWVEGRNLRFEYRSMGGDPKGAAAQAAELVALAPDVILSSGTVATQALHGATRTVPVVFVNVTDPVAGGFVASLARPGGNMTGFTPFEYPIAGKWLDRLRDLAPGLRRVALMGDPNNHNYKGFWGPFVQAATRHGIAPLQLPAPNAGEIERGLAGLASEPGAGLVVSAAAFSLLHRELLIGLCARLRVPAIYWSRNFPLNGGLMSYGPNSAALHRQSATYIDRILRGEKPSDLPVQEATRFETVINARTAKALDLAVPAGLALEADELID
ncbi:MAG: ABC transporter substrate-binding protein [Proteobacteria bacterium]|nr:ABC transporter substrate-binding protein [Pseudomonadota bacterium]